MNELNWESKCVSLPQLYKQTKGGKVQVWRIFTELYNSKGKVKTPKKDYINDLDLSKDYYVEVKTIYGQKDGKMQESSIRIDKGKNIGRSNETNVFKQGLLEMVSRWTKQQERLGYSLSEAESEILKIRPMLLHEYKKYHKYIDFKDAWVQEKMDGLRVMVSINDKGDVVLMSRQGAEFCHMNHIRDEVKKLGLNKHIHLDGELFSRFLNFNQIVSACKKVKKDSETDDEKSIKLYVFDLLDLREPDMPFSQRYKELANIFDKRKGKEESNIVLVQTERVKNDEDVQKWYNTFVEKGGEGAVIRDGKSKYLIGKRSHYALKLKPEDDAEFLIVGFKEGRGKDKGAVIFELETEQGKRFDARPALSYQDRVLMFRNGKDYIGKKGTVKFMGLTPDGVPRFPVFKAVRED